MSLRLSTAPHIRSHASTGRIMLNVIIALLPAACAGVYFYGVPALNVILVSCAAAVISEYVWQKLLKRPVRINDFSALLTGLILALTLPPSIPLWAAAIGSVFAIIIVKQLFGGIGDNFLNPAIAARAVLLASWPARMTTFTAATCFSGADAVASATPLAVTENYSYLQLLIGNIPGSIGETCKIAILIGFVYLVFTHTVSFRIPVFTMLSAFVFAFLFGQDPVYAVLSGGILFGAVFMATDYTTSPMAAPAQIAYAVGIGFLTMLIRSFGSYPEGVTYAVLFMNILTPLLDRYMPNKVYGHQKAKEAKKA
ncbi:MAG: RnfABCDGE type electron transport complex subunit D [Clostridia bacterium]|nr:RnfABCDGE type electron transport complex subunit D [Clostridia bacterium]